MRSYLIALALVLVLTPGAYAQKEPTAIDIQVEELAAELRCPVCQGLSIADSPSELSQQMKDVVRGQLESGKSPDEVKAYFVSKYGEWILLSPKPAGMNLAVYLAPLILLLGGGGLIVYMVRKWSGGSHVVGGEVLDEEEALR